MEYKIEKLNIEDINDLYNLLINVFKIDIKLNNLYKLIDNKSVIDLVAKVDNHVIGHALVEIRYDLFTNDKYFYLNYFCVDELYRKNGVGNSLLIELEKLALEYNTQYMKFTSNNKRIEAHSFYKNRGYSIRDTSVFIKYFRRET